MLELYDGYIVCRLIERKRNLFIGPFGYNFLSSNGWCDIASLPSAFPDGSHSTRTTAKSWLDTVPTGGHTALSSSWQTYDELAVERPDVLHTSSEPWVTDT
jgi:hypothetical protein